MMIEDAKEESDIVRPSKRSKVALLQLRARTQEAGSHAKTLPALQVDAVLASHEVSVLKGINRRHVGTAALTQEREVAIPAPDVQDGLASQSTWHRLRAEFLASPVVVPGRCHALAQIDGVPPKWNTGDRLPIPLPMLRIRGQQAIPSQFESSRSLHCGRCLGLPPFGDAHQPLLHIREAAEPMPHQVLARELTIPKKPRSLYVHPYYGLFHGSCSMSGLFYAIVGDRDRLNKR